ncbi:MAG: acetylornithine transaminase [Propionibacterium sp.]|nr:acetylornithine transaminase [Propionibacterium sp.]
MTGQDLSQRYADVMMNTFGAPKRVFVEGRGVHVRDADGREYTDLLSGLAVLGLGHANARVTAAIAGQLDRLGHISNLYASEPQIELAERLVAALGVEGAKVFFSNSGSEANEAAFKLTRLTGRTKIVAMEGSFHGRTSAALAVTHTPKYREPFEPLPGDVVFVPFGDVAALEAAVDGETAAVLLEVIQGENGVVPAPEGYVAAARRITEAHGALLWIDEVQTGIGRCGAMFAHTEEGVVPDLVTVAKGLGNGFPVGACLATGAAAQYFTPGQHGTTFGGNPVAAAAGNAVLDVLEDGLLAHVVETGEWLADALTQLGHLKIKGVRGRGLLRGVVLDSNRAPAIAEAALEAGFIINAPRPDVLRLAPPLIITREELRPFVDALPGLLDRHG